MMEFSVVGATVIVSSPETFARTGREIPFGVRTGASIAIPPTAVTNDHG